jgi:cellobiose dehydrogenase (acceptor)
VATYLQSFLGNGHRTALAQYANVTRVLRSGSRCTGVEVFQCNPEEPTNCQFVNVSVSENSGQVVLAAGALLTPKILYFSGIGPNDILTRLSDAGQLSLSQMDWIVNENVGTGLYDNTNTFLVLHSSDVQSYGFGYNGNGLGVVPADLSSYSSHRSGPYACPGQTGVFWDTVLSSDGRNVGVCPEMKVCLLTFVRCKERYRLTDILATSALVVSP